MGLFNNIDSNMFTKRISELELAVASLEKENSEYKDTIEEFASVKEQEVNEFKQRYTEDMKVVIEKEVNKRINQTLQSVGVNTFLMEIPVEVKSPKEVYDKFSAMPPGSEKQKFYQENELLIRKAMGLS